MYATSPALRRRILISNLLMVLIPVIATGFVGLACTAAIWHSLSLGRGFDDSADLREATLAATALVDRALSADASERQGRLDDLDRFLDKTGLVLDMTDANTGEALHSHGAHTDADAVLVQTVDELGGEATVEQGGRALTIASLEAGGQAYELHFFGDIHESATYPQLKASIVAAGVLVLAVVLASSVLTSRIVARFLVRRFEEELDRSNHELAASNERLATSASRLAAANAELTRSGERLEQANGQLRRRDAARRQLLADISHDLRSPLTSVRGYAEGLLDGIATSPERQRRYLEVIRDKTEQVSGLVENLLAFSKLELDDYPVHLKTLDLDAFATECARGFEALHEGELAVEVAADGNTYVSADRELLGRSITNVLDNSVKYRRGALARVHLTVRTGDGRAELEIADEGQGVAAEDVERLFDPFFRTDAVREHPEDGSGMGLAFVRRALELMGGTATASPREPHGLAVTLSLPRAADDGADPGTARDAGGPTGPSALPTPHQSSEETGATHGEDPARRG